MINKFTEKGYWKTPKMDKWFYGELSFDPETGGKLELTSNELFPSFRIDENKILIGESSTGDLFTLIDYSQNGFKGSTVHYNIKVIIKGCHIMSKKDLLFKTVKFELLNSRRWYGKRGINYEDISDGFKIEYKRPSSINFKTCEYDGEVRFGISRRDSGTDSDISLKEYAFYLLNYTNARSLQEILTDVMIHTEFITLMTFRQSYPRHIILGGPEGSSEAGDRNAIFFRHSFYSSNIKENWSGLGLVDYS